MIYNVAVRLSYDYMPAAPAGRNVLRLRPLELHGRQRVLSAAVSADPPPQERADRSDFFGNAVTETVHRTAASRTVFALAARVERLAERPSLDLSPGLAGMPEEIAAIESLGPGSPHHFCAPSPRVPMDDGIADLARRSRPRKGSAAETVAAFGHALHDRLAFDATATTVDTPAAVAFALGRGVCQDFAHIMLSGLRALGIPSAYVSGLLNTTPAPGTPRLEGADAMHAWVRAWCGRRMGWIEFDPTNACEAGEGHIAVALGRDYDDVAPVQGVLRAAGAARGSQAVDVIPVSQPE